MIKSIKLAEVPGWKFRFRFKLNLVALHSVNRLTLRPSKSSLVKFLMSCPVGLEVASVCKMCSKFFSLSSENEGFEFKFQRRKRNTIRLKVVYDSHSYQHMRQTYGLWIQRM